MEETRSRRAGRRERMEGAARFVNRLSGGSAPAPPPRGMFPLGFPERGGHRDRCPTGLKISRFSGRPADLRKCFGTQRSRWVPKFVPGARVAGNGCMAGRASPVVLRQAGFSSFPCFSVVWRLLDLFLSLPGVPRGNLPLGGIPKGGALWREPRRLPRYANNFCSASNRSAVMRASRAVPRSLTM